MGCLSSTLIYADSGSGKTAWAGSWATWVRQKTGKKVRLYTAEPGGLETITPWVAAGIVDVWDLSTRPNHFETLDFASRGYWPDPADPNKLIAPNLETYETYGGFIFEGATAFGELLLDELRIKGAANEIVGIEAAPQRFTSGTLKVAGNNQSHYGVSQARVRKAINDSQRLPVHCLWSARELKVRDEESTAKQYVFGPLLAGQAATLMMPAWFGNCIHIQARKSKDAKGIEKLIRRMHTTRHFDEGSDIPYLAQLRVPPMLASQVKDYYDLDPEGETVIQFLNQLDTLRETAKQQLLAKVSKA